MSIEQIALQLSIASLTVVVLLKVVVTFVKSNREAEAERTRVIGEGFRAHTEAIMSLNVKIDDHEDSEQAHHSDTKSRLAGIEGKLGTAITMMKGPAK